MERRRTTADCLVSCLPESVRELVINWNGNQAETTQEEDEIFNLQVGATSLSSGPLYQIPIQLQELYISDMEISPELFSAKVREAPGNSAHEEHSRRRPFRTFHALFQERPHFSILTPWFARCILGETLHVHRKRCAEDAPNQKH